MVSFIALYTLLTASLLASPLEARTIERDGDFVIISKKGTGTNKKGAKKKKRRRKVMEEEEELDPMNPLVKTTLCVILGIGGIWVTQKDVHNFFYDATNIDLDEGPNNTGVPNDKPVSDQQLIENIVHAMCLDPESFPRTSGRGRCVKYRKESYFKNEKAYQVFMASLDRLGGSLDERKKKLVEDTLKVKYKKYDLSKEDFNTIWEKEYDLPQNFEDMIYETHAKKVSFQLKNQYKGNDGKDYMVCGPGFQNKNFGGGFIDGACAYEEWRWFCAPAEAVIAELIKIKALREAISLGKGLRYAYKLRTVNNRAYIIENIPLYMRLGHYGGAFSGATIQEIKDQLVYHDPHPIFHIEASAAPDRATGAGAAGTPYELKHMKYYAHEAYAPALAQTKYFLEEKKENCTYKELGNKGTGAFPHLVEMPYLVQLFAYECERQNSNVKDKVRLMLYPFDDSGLKGLEEAKVLWPLIVAKAAGQKVSLKKFCELAIECAKDRGKPFKFKSGNGT